MRRYPAISIHAPRVGGDIGPIEFWRTEDISIHAPRVGGDVNRYRGGVVGVISIHAPRVGGDSAPSDIPDTRCNFNPRPPCGGRPKAEKSARFLRVFQSTPPVWGATRYFSAGPVAVRISIHAPRVGGDVDFSTLRGLEQVFQSTPPVWGATPTRGYRSLSLSISIHAPRVGGDSKNS